MGMKARRTSNRGIAAYEGKIYLGTLDGYIVAINADPTRCEKDERGRCLSVDLCYGMGDPSDECLSETEQRAWSSPIYVEPTRGSTQASTETAGGGGRG